MCNREVTSLPTRSFPIESAGKWLVAFHRARHNSLTPACIGGAIKCARAAHLYSLFLPHLSLNGNGIKPATTGQSERQLYTIRGSRAHLRYKECNDLSQRSWQHAQNLITISHAETRPGLKSLAVENAETDGHNGRGRPASTKLQLSVDANFLQHNVQCKMEAEN